MHTHLCSVLLLAALGGPLAAATVEGTITFTKGTSAGLLAWVPGVTKANVPPAVIDQKDKIFSPSMIAVRPGATITMRNSDAIQHNAYANDKATAVSFDTGLNAPSSDTPLKVDWPAGKVVRLGCKIHPAMQVWIASLDTDAWTVPALGAGAGDSKLATFTVTDVPADATKLGVWTSKFGEVELVLKAGTAVSVTLGTADKPAGTVQATLKP